ncbi:hypothetical protein OPKNFCMD_2464 [Methylobacterium crusticola]|uniref:Uncharacterized protein n=1 Tax=Methylobacterium crusticola TaxID=1697972 RepID=A0ABQ4QYL4_9HYPH|nr:hypothetical protein OPKNFCMD_2464 [Methylobacterium crusticola]
MSFLLFLVFVGPWVALAAVSAVGYRKAQPHGTSFTS